MNLHEYSGGCSCGNVEFEMELTDAAGTYRPRACDCDFCRAHIASYVSDRCGKLRIRVKDETRLIRRRQGSGIADCLVCRTCGILIGIVYEDDGRLYAAVNSKAVRNAVFGTETAVSPKKLGDEARIQRWKEVWFSDVTVIEG